MLSSGCLPEEWPLASAASPWQRGRDPIARMRRLEAGGCMSSRMAAHVSDCVVVGGELLPDTRFELIEPLSELLVRAQVDAELRECADDVDAHLDAAGGC